MLFPGNAEDFETAKKLKDHAVSLAYVTDNASEDSFAVKPGQPICVLYSSLGLVGQCQCLFFTICFWELLLIATVLARITGN